MKRDDNGQVSVLIVGFFAILIVLIGAVVDASAAFLQRAALNSIADSAALAATEGIKSEYIYTQGLDREARIDAEAAADYARSYLAQSGAQASYPGLRAHISAEGNVVRVRLSAPMNLPIPVPGVVGRPIVTAEAESLLLVQ